MTNHTEINRMRGLSEPPSPSLNDAGADAPHSSTPREETMNKHVNQSEHQDAQPLQRGPSSAGDTIVELALQIVEIEKRFIETDHGESLGYEGLEKTYFESEQTHLFDRCDALWSAVAALPADSQASAHVQLMALDRIAHELDVFEFKPVDRDRMFRQQKRLIQSISSVIRDEAGSHKIVSSAYQLDHLNPWLTYEERLDIIRQK